MSAMNTPPRKLLNAENRMSAGRSGTWPMTSMVPRRSTVRFGAGAGSSGSGIAVCPAAASTGAGSAGSAVAGARSATGTAARCATARASTPSARTNTQNMPPIATRIPLITDVTRKVTPDVVPTRKIPETTPVAKTDRVCRTSSRVDVQPRSPAHPTMLNDHG
ncbi:hypothetical protein GCM10010399_91250 [Dactylosporangium fulvum]